jgi:hypothetical protein
MEEIDTSYLRNAYGYNKIALNKFDLVYYELDSSEKELVKDEYVSIFHFYEQLNKQNTITN